jgi:tetratricopeptide (TPR) repeat protein
MKTARFVFPLSIIVAATFVMAATFRDAKSTAIAAAAPALPLQAGGTSRAELSSTVAKMTARLQAKPDDAAAVVSLANALVRLQRVNSDARAVTTADQRLRNFLEHRPGDYDARRMLAVVLLSEHRFGDAIAEANKTMAIDPRDAWNFGAAGDGYMELGDYDRAFAAFDRMGQLQPGPPAYARVSYALEIKGDLQGALDYMSRASAGTSPNDPESQAWHFCQIGELLLQLGRIHEARLEFERSDATFPNHPLAVIGRARVAISEGDLAAARLILQRQLAVTPTSDVAMMIADLSEALADAAAAASYAKMAEQIERGTWQSGIRQPQVLARFFAERGVNVAEAVTLAEEAARARRDIFTMDTLAFAYLKAGRLDDARRASGEALRTGTRDARVLWHAAELHAASGDTAAAMSVLSRIPAVGSIGDVRVRGGVAALQSRLSQ